MLFGAFSLSAAAQRTSNKQFFLSGDIAYTGTSLGFEVQFGQYLLNFYYSAGFNVANRATIETNHGEVVSFLQTEFTTHGMWRFFGTRSRNLNLYIGPEVFVGLEWMDPLKSLSEPARQGLYNIGYKKSVLIYGVSPEFELEFFPLPRFALIFNAKMPVTIQSQYNLLGFQLGLGGRYNF